jgi:hypothetical protein
MQRSQSKILRVIANAPWYVTNHTLHTDFNIPYVSEVIHERINKHHNNPEAHPNPLSEPLLQPINTRILKRCWSLNLPRQLRWHRWMNTLPRHSNTLYRSVLCIIIILAYTYIVLFLIANKKCEAVIKHGDYTNTASVVHSLFARFLYLYCSYRCVISKFSRCILSNTTRQMLMKTY